MLTLDDINGMPTHDPDALVEYLQNAGHLQRPVPPPAPEPVQLNPMTPPAATEQPKPVSSFAPMTPPAKTATEPIPSAPAIPSWNPISSREPGAPMRQLGDNSPAVPQGKIPDFTPPSIEGTAPTAPSSIDGIKPLTPPNLSTKEQLALPQTSPGVDIGSAAYTRNQLERDAAKRNDPWGSADNHPGFWGKLGHIAARAGNIAGDILVPNVMASIPGTDLNNNLRTQGLKRELAQRTGAEEQEKSRESEEAVRDLQKQEIQQRLSKQQNEQNLEKDAEGNILGWKDGQGVLHSIDDPNTPEGIKSMADETTSKPHFEKTANGDIVQITPGKNGQAAKSDVVYKGQPGQKTETRSVVGPDGKSYDKVFDITPGSQTFGQPLATLGRSKEDKQPSLAHELAEAKRGEEPVIGYDKDGVAHIVPHAQAEEMGLQHVIKASDKDRQDAQNNTSALNEVGVKARNVVGDVKALDQDIFQRGRIAYALAHSNGGTIDSLLKSAAMTGATELTKNYVIDVNNLREAVLALPKVTTGGSRMTEVQAEALWKTVADGSSADSKYALKQLRKFDEMVGRQWKKVPRVEGNEPERTFPEGKGGSGGGGQTHEVGDVIIQNGHQFKVTAVDKNGKPTGADPL